MIHDDIRNILCYDKSNQVNSFDTSTTRGALIRAERKAQKLFDSYEPDLVKTSGGK